MTSKQVRAVTVWQPWATLIALGVKPYETRHWATPWRGVTVIHASAKRDADIVADCLLPEVREVLKAHGYQRLGDLPFGAAVCICNLVDCIPTEKIPVRERVFGDFSSGRYAWKLTEVRRFEQPIPATGSQGLWVWRLPLPETPTIEVVKEVIEQPMLFDVPNVRRTQYE